MNDNCRYCGEIPNKNIRTLSYWKSVHFISCPECKVDGEKQEAIDCQIIDADCNDCKHFQRASFS